MRLLFFKAPWCTACHAIEETVPEYAIHVDCHVDQDTPTKYNVSGLPLFIATDDSGIEIARIQTTNVRAIDRWFKELIDGNKK